MSAIANEQIVDDVKKGVITAATNLASSGKLNPEQANRFIDFVVDESMLTSFARVVRFTPETLDIDKLGIGNRAAVPKSEAVDPGIRRGITTSKVTLTPREIMLPFEISDIFSEINLEGQGVEEHIVRMFARQFANDTEDLYLHGDDAGPLAFQGDIIDGGSATEVIVDTYLELFNGFLQLTNAGNVVDHAGNALSMSLFRQMLSAMPTKFKRDKRQLRWLVPVELDEIWRERAASRATTLGDMALNGQGNLTPFGIEMVPVPLMQFHPTQTEIITFTGDNSTIQLGFAPIDPGTSIVILDSDANASPTTPFVEDTDYAMDNTNGTITHDSGGAIANNAVVRVTYNAFPQVILTMANNLIIGIGRDIRMERDRDIFRGVNQFAMTAKIAAEVEELTAVVKANNISDTL